MNFNQDAVIRVGSPPPGNNQGWVTRTVHVHDFASLSTVRGQFVKSPEIMLLGNQWRLGIFPGGDLFPCGDEGADEGMVSVYLANGSDKAIEIDYGFSINDENGRHLAYDRSYGPHNFASVWDDDGISARGFDFVTHSVLLSSLVNGTLIIGVHMNVATQTKSVPPPFIPENPSSCKTIQGIFLDEIYSDIVFEVGADKGRNNATKVAETAPVTFSAHLVIVAKCSSILAELCESHGDKLTPISISGVSPDIFRVLLNYMYGGKLSEDDMKSHAKEIIDAADKYGVVNLKLEAEASFVVGTTFTIENVMELLLYAESKNCALLKEASMDYIVENKAEVITMLSFADMVPGH